MRKIFLNETIGKKFLQWKGGDEIFIQTPTGSGKTTFIMEILAEYAMEKGKEVLLLVNRKILREQICRELAGQHGVSDKSFEEIARTREFGGITVLTYQEVQEQLKKKEYPMGVLFEERFCFIVCDECHYFLEDSMFNRAIPYLLKALPKIKNAAKIFMSATGEEVFPFLMNILHKSETVCEVIMEKENERIVRFQESIFTGGMIFQYLQKPLFRIGPVRYFWDVKEIVKQINQDKSGEKWLIFVSSKIEAQRLKEGLEVSFLYLDADVDDDVPVKKQIVKKSKFAEKVLIATKVLDNGINLKDRDLRNIVLMTTERAEFLQMLGRKRFDEGEENVNLFLLARGMKFFNFQLNKKIRPMLKYIDEIQKDFGFRQERMDDAGFYEFCQKMAIIEKGRITVSNAAKEKIRLTQKFCEEMLGKLKENPHALVLEQLSWIGKEEDFREDFYLESGERKESWQKIFDFMDGARGKKMDKPQQETFRSRFAELAQEYGENLTDRSSRLAGKAKINQFCGMKGIPFRIEAVKNSKFWIIKEMAENETENLCD